MSRAGRGVTLALLVAGAAEARPHAHARAHDPSMPLRVVVAERGVSIANCLFSTGELPQNASVLTATRDSFAAGEPIWARCYLPSKPGPSRAGDLVDSIAVDGKPAWEQAYDQALPAAADSRSVAYGELLRTLFAALKPGPHRIQLVGRLRHGKKQVPLYRGSFRYVR